jgi:hypothetical protein
MVYADVVGNYLIMRSLIFFTFFSLSISSYATPKVWLSEGAVFYLQEVETEWNEIAVGIALSEGVRVKLENGAYLALVDKEGAKLIELTEDGEYTSTQLDELFAVSPVLPALGDQYFEGFTDRVDVLRCSSGQLESEYRLYPFLDAQRRFKAYDYDTIDIDVIKNVSRKIEAHTTLTDLSETVIWKDPMYLDSVATRQIPVQWFRDEAEEPFILLGVEEHYIYKKPIYNSLDELVGYEDVPKTRLASNRMLVQLISVDEAKDRIDTAALLNAHQSTAYQLYLMLWALENDYPFFAYKIAKTIKPLKNISGTKDYREGMSSIFGID